MLRVHSNSSLIPSSFPIPIIDLHTIQNMCLTDKMCSNVMMEVTKHMLFDYCLFLIWQFQPIAKTSVCPW